MTANMLQQTFTHFNFNKLQKDDFFIPQLHILFIMRALHPNNFFVYFRLYLFILSCLCHMYRYIDYISKFMHWQHITHFNKQGSFSKR